METFVPYVNDAIHYGMKPEQVLYYDDMCFGTADTIAFEEDEKLLRIHDLKTGMVPAHMDQLRIYAALFCLEYDFLATDLTYDLRIYQNGKKETEIVEGDIIFPYVDNIKTKLEWLKEYEEADNV